MNRSAKIFLLLSGILLLFFKLTYDLFRGASDSLSPNLANDSINLIWPAYEFAKTSIESGNLPLWNPYSGIGAPLFADGIMGLLYPINWIILILDVPSALLVILYLTVLIGMAGMYLYTRYIGLVWPARILAVVVFAYSVFTEAMHPALGSVFCWLPLLLWLTHRFFDEPSYRNGTYIAIALSLCFLGGFPNFFYYTCLTLGAYFLVLFLLSSPRYGVQGSVTRTMILAVSLVSVLGLVAVQLLPMYELLMLSVRNVDSAPAYLSTSFWEVFSLGFMLKNFMLANSAYIYGNNLLKLDSGLYYLGGALLLVLPFPFLLKEYRNISIALTVAFIFLCLFMLSNQVPGLSFIQGMPGASALRINGRAIVYAQFLLIVLSAVGLSVIYKGVKQASAVHISRAMRLAWVLYPLYLAMLIAAAYSIPDNNGLLFGFIACAVLIALVLLPGGMGLRPGHIAWVIALVIILDVSVHRSNRFLVPAFITHESDVIAENVPRMKALSGDYRALFVPLELEDSAEYANLGHKYGIASISSYSSLTLARWENYLRHMMGAKNFDAIIAQSILQRFYGEISIPLAKRLLKAPDVLSPLSLRYIVSENGTVENLQALPRVYTVSQFISVNGELDSLAAVKDNLDSLGELVVLENAVPSFQPVEGANGYGSASLAWLGTNEVEVSVDLVDPAILVFTDAYFPGWRAEIDGKEAAIYPANYLFKAVEVPPGSHLIRFYYLPSGLYWGAGITLLSAMFMSLLVFRERRSEKRLRGL